MLWRCSSRLVLGGAISFSTPPAAEPVMKATEAQLDAAGVDQAWRDYCAHLLIPLNKCRRANLFAPWKCVDERHGYEKCQYDQYVFGVMHLWCGVPWKRQPGGTEGADCRTIAVEAGRGDARPGGGGVGRGACAAWRRLSGCELAYLHWRVHPLAWSTGSLPVGTCASTTRAAAATSGA